MTGGQWFNRNVRVLICLQKTEHGITGPITFDDMGRRTHFFLEIIESSKDGFKKIGTWDPTYGVNYTRTQSEVDSQRVEALQNKTFIVVSRLGAPFLTER